MNAEPGLRHGEPSTLELMQLLLGRFGSSDAAGVARLFAPRVEWRGPTPAYLSGSSGTRTPRELESFALALYDLLGVEALTVCRLVVEDDAAAVVGSVRGRVRGTGARLVLDFTMSITVEDGLVRACWLLPDTLAAAIAFTQARVAG